MNVNRRRYLALILCAAFTLAGCAGTTRAPSLYVLDDGGTPPDREFAPDAPLLVVAPVHLSTVLDESGIIYQTSPHRVVIANNHRWAAPLAGQLRDALITELAETLPETRVVRAAPESTRATLTLTPRVDAFMGHFDGRARIAGEWQVYNANGASILQRRFARRVPLPQNGYDALVDSLATGWRAQVKQLGEVLAARLDRSAANDAAN